MPFLYNNNQVATVQGFNTYPTASTSEPVSSVTDDEWHQVAAGIETPILGPYYSGIPDELYVDGLSSCYKIMQYLLNLNPVIFASSLSIINTLCRRYRTLVNGNRPHIRVIPIRIPFLKGWHGHRKVRQSTPRSPPHRCQHGMATRTCPLEIDNYADSSSSIHPIWNSSSSFSPATRDTSSH